MGLSGTFTLAAKQAKHDTSRGAIKGANMVGILLNNENDKKELQETYVIHIKAAKLLIPGAGCSGRFPDTPNSRFQAIENAGREIIIYLDYIIEFLRLL